LSDVWLKRAKRFPIRASGLSATRRMMQPLRRFGFNMTDQPELDEARVRALNDGLYRIIRANYLGMPPSAERVYEALNALAICSAVVLTGTGPDEKTLAFFKQALEQNLELLKEEMKGQQGMS
jgi:hypothetical protein